MHIDHETASLIGFYGTLCVLCCAVALIDFRHGIIPDWLNLAIAALGLINAVITDGATAAFTAIAMAGLVGWLFWSFQRLYRHDLGGRYRSSNAAARCGTRSAWCCRRTATGGTRDEASDLDPVRPLPRARAPADPGVAALAWPELTEVAPAGSRRGSR
jgi:hypothetical protein